MNLVLNCHNLVRQLLPPHKRQPVRISLLAGFLSPLQASFADFTAWRSDARMIIGVNSQVRVLERYLRKKYKDPAVRIVTPGNGLLPVGLESEGSTMWPFFSLEHEGRMPAVPLEHEIRDKLGDADFIVYISASADPGLIGNEIEKYKQALVTYKIIQR